MPGFELMTSRCQSPPITTRYTRHLCRKTLYLRHFCISNYSQIVTVHILINWENLKIYNHLAENYIEKWFLEQSARLPTISELCYKKYSTPLAYLCNLRLRYLEMAQPAKNIWEKVLLILFTIAYCEHCRASVVPGWILWPCISPWILVLILYWRQLSANLKRHILNHLRATITAIEF